MDFLSRGFDRGLKKIFDGMPDAIHVVDEDLKIVFFNRKFSDWSRELGLPFLEAVGRNLFEIFPFLQESVRDEYRKVFRTQETLTTEDRNIVGGNEMITETRKIPIFEGDKVVLVLTIVSDITVRKQSLESSREADKNFKLIFDNARDGLVMADVASRRFFSSNSAFRRMLGYEEQEIQRLGVEDIHPPDALPFVLDQFDRLVRGEISQARKVPVLRKDGKILFADITTAVMTLGGKKVSVGFFREVTDLVKLEEERVAKLGEAERHNKLLVGREKRIIELKKEVDEALAEAGKPPRYRV